MPFQFPMRPYTSVDVLMLQEGQNGVYGIFRGTACIYVGKGDVRSRLLDHLNNDNPCISSNKPDQWTAVITPDADDLEKKLIYEYKPFCNKRVG
jgi:hypothetical protein